MKKLAFVLTLIVVASMLIMAAAPAATTLARLTIKNQTGDPVSMRLTSGTTQYYLTTDSGDTNVYTVARKVYTAQFWACDTTASGVSLDVLTNLKLNFPSCSSATNAGEPSMEKVHLKSTPDSLLEWRFQY